MVATVATAEYQLVTAAPAALGALVEAQVALGYGPLGVPYPSGANLEQVMFRGAVASFIQEYAITAVSTTPTAGFQNVTSDTPVAAGDNALTTVGTYYFKVATDGGAIIEYSVVIAGATTYTALAALMDTAYTLGTVAFVDATDSFLFTSGTTGNASSVSVTAGTTGTDVFVQIIADAAPTAFSYGTPVAGSTLDRFTIAGDQTKDFNAGYKFTVTRSTGNNAVYSVADGGSALVAGATSIPVNEAVPNTTPDGFIEAYAPSVGP